MPDLSEIFNGKKILPENWLVFSFHGGAYYESDGYRDTWLDHIVIDAGGNEICKITDRESMMDTQGKRIPPGYDYIISGEGLFYDTTWNKEFPGKRDFLLVTSSPVLQAAAALASRAFNEKYDKGHQPYIYHLVRVMLKGRNDHEKIVGVLHDLMEDCDENYIEEFRRSFEPDIVEAVQSMTKIKDENYDDYLHRVKNNPVAGNVKIHDLMDNMNIGRIKNPGADDIKRMKKYEKALRFLKD